MIVRAGGAIWLNPFTTVLFSLCSAVTVKCCVLYPCYVGVCGMFAVMLCSYPVSFQLLRGETCMGALVYIFISFWDGDYASHYPYVWYYVGVKSRFQHAHEECESKGDYLI